MNISKRFAERNRILSKKCSNETVPGGVMLVTGHTPANVTLCVVPKAACTQWLGLFKFLANQNTSNKTLLEYSKFYIHDGGGKPYVRYKVNGKDKTFINNSHRVITARDPYTRLWSAYIDKFWLPSGWKDKGIQVIKMVRSNATSHSKSCGHDVTFSEFLQYVINIGHSMNFWGYDYHWLPVTDICNPCKFNPHYIVKQETFFTDFKLILGRVGLLHVVEPKFTANQDEIEISNEIDYAFRMYSHFQSCMNKTEFAERLWNAMIYNGYLQPEVEFPREFKEEVLKPEAVIRLVLEARKKHNIESRAEKAIRKQILSEVYSQIPDAQIAALKQLYRLDFELFDYNSSPPIL